MISATARLPALRVSLRTRLFAIWSPNSRRSLLNVHRTTPINAFGVCRANSSRAWSFTLEPAMFASSSSSSKKDSKKKKEESGDEHNHKSKKGLVLVCPLLTKTEAPKGPTFRDVIVPLVAMGIIQFILQDNEYELSRKIRSR